MGICFLFCLGLIGKDSFDSSLTYCLQPYSETLSFKFIIEDCPINVLTLSHAIPSFK